MDRNIGRMLDGRYEILEVIGTGGMAVVYKARCHRLNRLVAIKILRDENLQDDDFRRRFHAEGQAVGMLSHPNIVSVYDVATEDDMDYIVMELVEGITLKQYMEKKGVLNWKETLHFAIQIAKALDHAHSRGLVHRDIKPHNVMVLKNGSVRVTDFGIARIMTESNTLTKEALGSVHYISPEQAKGGRVDHRSDLYSLGVVMYEMITGRPPYDGESPVSVAIQHIAGGALKPTDLNPNMPEGLEQIILKAMANDLKDRYSSAMDMMEDMDELRKDPSMVFPMTPVKRNTEKPNIIPIEPVKPVPPVDSKKKKKDYEEAELSRGKAATVAIVSCCAAIMVAVVIFLILFANGGLFQNETLTYEVPKLVNMHFDNIPNYDGLTIVKQDEAYSEEYAAGTIIDQLPAPGTVVEAGRKVLVTVSLGPKPPDVTMPGDLVGKTEVEVKTILQSLNMELDIKVQEDHSETVEAGVVLEVSIQEGEVLYKGQQVVLTVSIGKEIRIEEMPNLLRGDGISKADAERMLALRGFSEVTWVAVESRMPEGIVVSQSVEAGTPLDVTTPIVIEYSNGVKPIATIFYTFANLPLMQEKYTLTIMQGDEVLLQARDMQPGETSYSMQLTGRGKVEYTIYVNFELYTTVTVDFS